MSGVGGRTLTRKTRNPRETAALRLGVMSSVVAAGLLLFLLVLTQVIEPLGPLEVRDGGWPQRIFILITGSVTIARQTRAGVTPRRPRLTLVLTFVGGLIVTAMLLRSVLVVSPGSSAPLVRLLAPAALLFALGLLDLPRHPLEVAVTRSRRAWTAAVVLLSVVGLVGLIAVAGRAALLGPELLELVVALALMAGVGWCVQEEALRCSKVSGRPWVVLVRLVASVPRTAGRIILSVSSGR